MTVGNKYTLLRNILALSGPAIVTNITTPLLGITDVAIAGHMGSAAYIAAIAVGSSMFNMLYWLFGFLRMGSSGMTAQAYGAGNERDMWLVFYRAMIIAVGVGCVFILLRGPVAEVILYFMDTDADTRSLAMRYFMICVWGAPAVLGTYVLTGWFVGMQNSRVPMWVSIFIDLFNMALSVMLVYAIGMKLEGIAVGTLAAQWGGFLLGLWICVRKFHPIKVSGVLKWHELKRFFAVNTDIFLRTVCLVAVTMWFTRVGASQGAVMLAVNALLMQMFTLFSFFMDGFAFAGEALCGRFKGAGDYPALRRCIAWLFRCSGVLAVIFTVLYFCFGQTGLQLLSSDHEVVERSAEFFWWAVTIPLAGFAAFTWDGVFIGTTDTRSMLLSMACATAVFFGLYASLYERLGNHGLWIAFLGYLLTRGVALTVIARRSYLYSSR